MLVLQHLRGGLNFLAGFSPAASLPGLHAGLAALMTPYCMYVQAVHKSVAVCNGVTSQTVTHMAYAWHAAAQRTQRPF
jgi:hypothetical protein